MDSRQEIEAPAAARRHGEGKPPWLRVSLPTHPNYFAVAGTLTQRGLNTICRSARCPNITECWSEKTATFLLLGDVCTRSCAFCAVRRGAPAPPDGDEPRRVAEAAASFSLAYVVLTSVTRDDLPDGGASMFALTAAALRERIPGVGVEFLVPDFRGDERALETVVSARPEVLGHNLEVPEALYPAIGRPADGYGRSLRLLEEAARRGALTKSGLMLGLGESAADVLRTLADLRRAGCGLLTLGQYLQPARGRAPVRRYCSPEEFDRWKRTALEMGFLAVEAGPLVRSSYRAHGLAGRASARLEA